MLRLADRFTSARLAFLSLLIFASAGWAAPAATQPDPKGDMTSTPSPAYTPEQVVRIQIDAMGRNDTPTPDAGIAIAFGFASPSNQKQTGPLEKFTRMVKTPEYRPMLDHRSADYGQTHQDGPVAQILVKVTGSGGEAALFLFVLSKQADGPYKDCWMTDGVMRLRPQDIVPMPPDSPAGGNGDGHDKT